MGQTWEGPCASSSSLTGFSARLKLPKRKKEVQKADLKLDGLDGSKHIRSLSTKEALLLDQDQDFQTALPSLTAEIVASYVANNTVHVNDLPSVISSVHAALTNLGQPSEPEPEKLTPPVSIRKSIGDDFLISMEDGRRYKSLKRHLSGRGLTPQQYRQKWNLPSDYPMVAPAYARQRSELAKALGLGRKREEEPGPAPAPKRGARKKAAAPAEAA